MDVELESASLLHLASGVSPRSAVRPREQDESATKQIERRDVLSFSFEPHMGRSSAGLALPLPRIAMRETVITVAVARR